MTKSKSKKIAAISMVRNGGFFTGKWIEYYGSNIGFENLYLFIDGLDQPMPDQNDKINIIQKPHIARSRTAGDRHRARLISEFATKLFNEKGYDVVIAHDIDEYLIVDPSASENLVAYLKKPTTGSSMSALGVDVVQHKRKEKSIDVSIPFLNQRSYGLISSRYTKPVVATKPVVWGSGFHRIKGKNYKIDPNLFLFHFGMVDIKTSLKTIESSELNKWGWKSHFERRKSLFDLVVKKKPIDGDIIFGRARVQQTIFRPFFAWNKPTMIFKKTVVKIPERFHTVI